MKKLRISAISFLNTAPLMWDFEHPESVQGDLRSKFEIAYTVPSDCAEALRQGTADIGIIPAIAYQSIPDLVVIPEVAIASNGPVRSILIVSRKPLEEVQTLAADTSSRTSVILARIGFQRWWQPMTAGPEFIPMDPDLDKMLMRCDAGLLIGDSALTVDRSKYPVVVDLGEQWTRRTGKPFVYAFWAARQAALAIHPMGNTLAAIFQRSRDHGLNNVEKIAQEWTSRLAIIESSIAGYLRSNILYSFDAQQLAGLDLFFTLAMEIGGQSSFRRINFLSSAVVAAQNGKSP